MKDSTPARPLPCRWTSISGLYRSLHSLKASNSTTCTILIVSPSPSPTPRGADHPQDFKEFTLARWFPSRIATFPTQLLGEIFWYILFNLDGTPAKDIEVKRIMLRSTCQHWMNAVDSSSFLWTALVLEPFDLWYKDYRVPLNLVERFVRCSGEEPMSISIHASLERFPYYARTFADLVMRGILMQLVGPQGDVLKRWTTLKFFCCDHFDVSLLGSLGLWPAPLLTGVEINCPGPFGGIIELNAPMLRWIVHRECTLFFAPRPGFLWMDLTDLTLSAPSSFEHGLNIDFSGWLNIIRQTPRLMCLRLRTMFLVDEFLPGPLEKKEIIELPCLQQICINEDGPWKLLQYLRFPRLATMKIDGALSDTLCGRLMESAQCYDHLSHLKHLWFRRGIIALSALALEEGEAFYGEFLARLFPELASLIVPLSIYGYSNREATALIKVWPRDESWRLHVFTGLRNDTRFPNRAVINGGETVFKALFENFHDASSGALERYRDWCLKKRRS